MCLGALDWVDRGAVQSEPRVATEIRALARARHRAKHEFSLFEHRLDTGDPRRPVGSQGRNCLVSVSVERRLHAPGELWLCPFDVPPCRHRPIIASPTDWPPAGMRQRPLGSGCPQRAGPRRASGSLSPCGHCGWRLPPRLTACPGEKRGRGEFPMPTWLGVRASCSGRRIERRACSRARCSGELVAACPPG